MELAVVALVPLETLQLLVEGLTNVLNGSMSVNQNIGGRR